tara:strand:+ start:8149 stop:9693 length:1545 start_codon:yes stop_codon:yes gene_type:complete
MVNSTETLFKDAQACEKQGDWSGAVALYQAALAESPDFVEAQHNLALALRQLGQSDEALKWAQSAAALRPDHPTIQFSLGLSLEQTGQIRLAIEAYRNSAALRPNYVAALNNLGRLLEVAGDIPDSIKILDRALAQAPSDLGVQLNLANSYLQGGQPEKSIELLQALISQDNQIAAAHNSLGVAAHVTGDQRQAILHFREAIKLDPQFAEAHENLAQALLFEAEYEEAWAEYEWRWQNDSNTQSKRHLSEPVWHGESLAGRTLLVHAEQGFGDVIQFVRFLSSIEKSDGRLILACHAALVELFSDLDAVDQVVDMKDAIPQFDCHAPLLSLPRILGVDGTSIPNTPYIAPKLSGSGLAASKLKVGFAWAGMPRHEFDPHRNRSCPVEVFDSLTKLTEFEFYSLQTGPQAAELGKIGGSNTIIDLEPRIHNFNDTAKLVSELDLVISVDTALAHLAGAQGKKVWILLATCADWRWQHKVTNNPWYPTARLFRQKSPGNWAYLLDDVIEEIRTLIP